MSLSQLMAERRRLSFQIRNTSDKNTVRFFTAQLLEVESEISALTSSLCTR